jgi:hypothetical protein
MRGPIPSHVLILELFEGISYKFDIDLTVSEVTPRRLLLNFLYFTVPT